MVQRQARAGLWRIWGLDHYSPWSGLVLSQEIGDLSGQVHVLSNLALITRDLGDLDTATQLLSDGLNLANEQEDI